MFVCGGARSSIGERGFKFVLPGGFSYGDYLRCGSMASKSKIMQSVINFAKSGGLVMGICNGFQILVETGLVPGVLLRNRYLEFICKNVFVKLDNKDNSYFKNLDKEILEFHIAHNEGNYFCTKNQLKEAKKNGQIIYGGDSNEIENRISPTLIKIENRNDPLMKGIIHQ